MRRQQKPPAFESGFDAKHGPDPLDAQRRKYTHAELIALAHKIREAARGVAHDQNLPAGVASLGAALLKAIGAIPHAGKGTK